MKFFTSLENYEIGVMVDRRCASAGISRLVEKTIAIVVSPCRYRCEEEITLTSYLGTVVLRALSSKYESYALAFYERPSASSSQDLLSALVICLPPR